MAVKLIGWICLVRVILGFGSAGRKRWRRNHCSGLNIDLGKGRLTLVEKDTGYREAIVRALEKGTKL